MSDKKSKFWPRIAYSCGTFGHDVFYAMLGTYFMIFVTSNLFHSDNHKHDARSEEHTSELQSQY